MEESTVCRLQPTACADVGLVEDEFVVLDFFVEAAIQVVCFALLVMVPLESEWFQMRSKG